MILELDNTQLFTENGSPTKLRTMEEQEGEFLRITLDDVNESNKLSLHCPICSSPVLRDEKNKEMAPVECHDCEAIYHKACWDMAGGTCAIIGCDCKKCRPYGAGATQQQQPALNLNDVTSGRKDSPGSHNRYKAQERQMQREMQGGLFRRLFEWLLRQIKILDE